MAKAKQWEKKRDHAASEIPNFEYAEALYQIAIVLGSVAIVASSPWLLGLSGVLATCGLLLTLERLSAAGAAARTATRRTMRMRSSGQSRRAQPAH